MRWGWPNLISNGQQGLNPERNLSSVLNSWLAISKPSFIISLSRPSSPQPPWSFFISSSSHHSLSDPLFDSLVAVKLQSLQSLSFSDLHLLLFICLTLLCQPPPVHARTWAGHCSPRLFTLCPLKTPNTTPPPRHSPRCRICLMATIRLTW